MERALLDMQAFPVINYSVIVYTVANGMSVKKESREHFNCTVFSHVSNPDGQIDVYK